MNFFDIIGVILFLPAIGLLLVYFFPNDLLFKCLSLIYCLFIWVPRYLWNLFLFRRELKTYSTAQIVLNTHPEIGIKLGHFNKIINPDKPELIKEKAQTWQEKKKCFFIEPGSLNEELQGLRVNVLVCFSLYLALRLTIV